MVTSGSGRAEDWPIVVPSLNYWLRVRKARGRDERGGRRRPGEGGTASCAPASISGALEACINGMADMSGKWETGEIGGRG